MPSVALVPFAGRAPLWLQRLTWGSPSLSGRLEWPFFLWVLPGVFVVRALHRALPGRAAARAVPWTLLLLMLALGVRGFFDGGSSSYEERYATAALHAVELVGLVLACWALGLMLGSGSGTAPRPAAVARAVLGAALVALLTVPMAVWFAQTGVRAVWPDRYEGAEGLNQGQAELTTALRMFRDATGAYPRELADLTAARTPGTGLDPSANEVAIQAPAPLPLLPELPMDPVTGRRDTWVYDPRSPFLVESGAFTTTVHTGVIQAIPEDSP